MSKVILAVILFGLFMMPRIALGEMGHENLVHFAAHVGASYLLNTVIYGFSNRTLQMSKSDALIFAAITTLCLGAAYKYMEATSGANVTNFGQAMFRNSIGVGASAGTVLLFNF